MSAEGCGGQWYGGPGAWATCGRDGSPEAVRRATTPGPVRCGPDGRVGRPPRRHDPEWSLARTPRRVTLMPMQVIAPPRPARELGSLVGGTLLGAGLVAAGLCLAFITLETPFVSRLVAGRSGSIPVVIPALVWALALIAGGALLVAGTDQLAAMVAIVRRHTTRRSPVMRALGSLPSDLIVATGVVPDDGRTVPDLVIGPFGVAVVAEIGGEDTLRRIGQSWEMRTDDGWSLTEHPLDRAARDAERVRRWLGPATSISSCGCMPRS